MNRHVILFVLVLFGLLLFLTSCFNSNKNKELNSFTCDMESKDTEQAKRYYNKGLAWDIKDNFEQALVYYTKALEINPRHAQANNNTAWLMATCPDGKYRNGARAVECAQKAVASSRKADFLDTLAASYAEEGEFADAVTVQENALKALIEEGNTEKLDEYNARLVCYKGYNPWRKTNRIEDFKAPGGKPGDIIEEIIPGNLNKEDNTATIQESSSEIEQIPLEKAGTPLSHQVNGEKIAKVKQNVSPSFIEVPDKKSHTAVPKQKDEGTHVSIGRRFYPYTIHVSSFRSTKRSNDLADELRDQGSLTFTCPVHIPGKGDWCRVFVGYFETFEETRKVASKLRGKKDLYPIEKKLPYAVQIGVFDSDDELTNKEADLRLKSYLPYSIPDSTDNGNVRLLIGAYRAKEEAAELAQKLQEQGFSPQVVRR